MLSVQERSHDTCKWTSLVIISVALVAILAMIMDFSKDIVSNGQIKRCSEVTQSRSVFDLIGKNSGLNVLPSSSNMVELLGARHRRNEIIVDAIVRSAEHAGRRLYDTADVARSAVESAGISALKTADRLVRAVMTSEKHEFYQNVQSHPKPTELDKSTYRRSLTSRTDSVCWTFSGNLCQIAVELSTPRRIAGFSIGNINLCTTPFAFSPTEIKLWGVVEGEDAFTKFEIFEPEPDEFLFPITIADGIILIELLSADLGESPNEDGRHQFLISSKLKDLIAVSRMLLIEVFASSQVTHPLTEVCDFSLLAETETDGILPMPLNAAA